MRGILTSGNKRARMSFSQEKDAKERKKQTKQPQEWRF
jgi:hypothetical protein